jgi:hypothetical protein
MNLFNLALRTSFVAGLAASWGCGGSGSPSAATFTLVPLPAWDGGADAGCTVASTGSRVGCATAYEISGDPLSCAGFNGSGVGSTTVCQTICKSGLTCNLSGLSDGTDVVACQATCGSPEH